MKYLFIDIRKSDEVYSKHFVKSNEYSFYNIPMNMIRFNAQSIIDHLKYVDYIYIVCQTSSRSQYIKNKYFSNYDKIIVSKKLQFTNLQHGINKVSLDKNTDITINIDGSNAFNLYSIMRIIQIVMGIIILLSTSYIYIQIRNQKSLQKINMLPIIVLLLFGIMSLYNGVTSTCSISRLLQDYLI